MVDAYQPVLNDLTTEIGTLEDTVFLSGKSEPTVIREFRERKKELSDLQQIVRPQRDVVSRMARGEFKIIRPVLLPYFRDLLGNLNRIETSAATLHDQLYMTLDVFLNKASYETNEVVKVLTILTAVTTPSLLIGTWYGMNFEGMHELRAPHAYLIATFCMIGSTLATYLYFKKKKWF